MGDTVKVSLKMSRNVSAGKFVIVFMKDAILYQWSAHLLWQDDPRSLLGFNRVSWEIFYTQHGYCSSENSAKEIIKEITKQYRTRRTNFRKPTFFDKL